MPTHGPDLVHSPTPYVAVYSPTAAPSVRRAGWRSLARMALLAHTLVLLAAFVTGGVWPLAPRPEVVNGFSPPAQRWGAGHRGVDLLGHAGQTVRAAADGTVSFAGTIAGRGVVVVDHGATRTTYQPVDASVHRGAEVGAGDPIGTLVRFGSHCWPSACLHWGLIAGADTYLDPLTLVGAGPVRLLPLYSALPSQDLPLPQGPAGSAPAWPATGPPPTARAPGPAQPADPGLRFRRPAA